MNDATVILASASPRRLTLLAELDLQPEIRPADVDESVVPGEDAAGYVERLAREKVISISTSGAEIVIGADTTVVIDGVITGKPVDRAHAHAILESLSGRSHEVMTGVAVRRGQEVVSAVEVTVVTFAVLSEQAISWYINTGEPSDKAGAYGLQGAGGAFVSSVSGSVDNVIGLPRLLLASLLGDLGVDLFAGRSEAH